MHRRRPAWLALVAAAALLAGCASPGSEAEDPAEEAVPTPATPSVFVPDFDLVAPQILVDGEAPWLAGDEITLRATFPAESKVDPLRVRDILWDFGGEDYSVGTETTHAFERGGLYTLKVTVRDVYDRTASSTLKLSVGELYRFNGIVRVGSGGADAAAPDGSDAPYDHVDHVIPVAEGAASLETRLTYSQDNLYCPQPPQVCVPGEASLILRTLGPDGAKMAESATGAPPRQAAATIDAPGDYTLRVSGDKGVDVAYTLRVLVLFPAA